MRKTRAHIGVMLALGAALASCKVGPDYERPPLVVPPAYKSAMEQETAEPGLARDWWRLFDDPDLSKLEEEALQANQTLEAAMARVGEARAAAAAVKSQFFPIVTLNPSATRSRRPVLGGTSGSGSAASSGAGQSSTTGSTGSGGGAAQALASLAGALQSSGTGKASTTLTKIPPATTTPAPKSTTSDLFTIPFDLSYEVDIWGRVRRSYEAARAQVLFSVYDLEVVRQTLLADVAQDYFTLRSLDDQERIFARNIELFRQQVDLTETQFKSGLVNEINVLQAKTQLESTLVQQLDVRRQRADLEHAIAILLGRPPAQFSLAVRPLEVTPPKIPAGMPGDLLRRRPDVAEAEQSLAAACAQIGVATASFFPALTLTGVGGFESIKIEDALDWQNRIWTIGANVAAPIFEGGLLRANLRQAKAKYDEMLATYRNAVLTAFSDVEISLTDLHVRADEAEAQARAVAAARGNLDLTLTQYNTGFANYLQVIIAEQTVLSNELTAAQILEQRMISTVLLIKALGGGWDTQLPAPPLPPPHGPGPMMETRLPAGK